MSHVVGTEHGSDVQAFEVCISYSRAACERLGRAVLLHQVRVSSVFHLGAGEPQRGYAMWMILTVPTRHLEAAKATLGDADWKVPARPSVLLVFDPIDGATYTCPLCRRQQALEAL